MADFLDQKKREIDERLKELKPLVEEYHRLEGAARALDGVSDEPRATRRAPARRTGASRSGGAGRGRGRPKGTGARAKETLAIVRGQPGITIPEMAERMSIKQNYLYRVLPGLEADGMVRKEGRGWHPKEAA